MLVLAVNYSQQAQGVYVFDLDFNLISYRATRSAQAVKACEDAGYKLALNTAVANGLCGAKAVIKNAPKSGMSCGENVPKEMWMCRGKHLTSTGAKIANMKTAMAYYKTTKECMVYFDAKEDDVEAVTGAGFKGILVSLSGQGIVFAEREYGLAMIKGCDGRANTTSRFLKTQK
jgi:hypothetical protein